MLVRFRKPVGCPNHRPTTYDSDNRCPFMTCPLWRAQHRTTSIRKMASYICFDVNQLPKSFPLKTLLILYPKVRLENRCLFLEILSLRRHQKQKIRRVQWRCFVCDHSVHRIANVRVSCDHCRWSVVMKDDIFFSPWCCCTLRLRPTTYQRRSWKK